MVIKLGHGTTDERHTAKVRRRAPCVCRPGVLFCGIRMRIEAQLNGMRPTIDQA
jgi:hypothetical protein